MTLKKDLEQVLINLEKNGKFITPIYGVSEDMLKNLVEQDEKDKVLDIVNSSNWWNRIK